MTVKKGEAVSLFLERARGMSGRREWLRVSVDDLLLVRGEVIIPHVFLPPLPFPFAITNSLESTLNSTILSSIAPWGPTDYCLIPLHPHRLPPRRALRIPIEMILQ